MKYDVQFIGPTGAPGTHYALIADSAEAAALRCPYALSVNTRFTPDQFKVTSVEISIYEESK